MIIAFCGIDGSGKTGYSRFTVDYLKNKGIKATYRHIIRDSFYYSFLHNVIGKISSHSQKYFEDGLRDKKKQVRFMFNATLKKILFLINLAIFNLTYIRYKTSSRHNIICDRYFYDDLIQVIYLGSGGRLFLWFYESFIIKPDVTFFLKVCPETAYFRKPEYKKDYFIAKTKLYSKLFSIIRHIELNSHQIDENNHKITETIDSYFKLK